MDDEVKVPLLIVAGPTAVGKTAISLELAESLGGEIISADSQQVYQGLDIGTAKIPVDERRGIPHHLIDVVSASDGFSVSDFRMLADQAIRDIVRRGRLPILVGGTGLWIRALIRGYEFTPEGRSEDIRQQIQSIADQYGWDAVRRLLRVVDYPSYQAIHPQDHRRLSRALEVFWTTSKRLPRTSELSPYRTAYWVLSRPMTELQDRIRERVQFMLNHHFAEEVLALLGSGVSPRSQSLSAIGYREMVDWCYGKSSEPERNRSIVLHTRQYAKRQLTWFRSEKEARWLDLSSWGEERALTLLIQSGRELIDKTPGLR